MVTKNGHQNGLKNGKANILEQIRDIWQRNQRKLKQDILPGDKNYQNT